MGNWASSWVAGLKIPPNWRFLLFFHFREAFSYNWCDISKAWLFLSADKYHYKFTHNFDLKAPHYLLMIHSTSSQRRYLAEYWEQYVVTDHFIGSPNILSGLGILRAEKSLGAETLSCILTIQTLFLHSNTNFVILTRTKPEIYNSLHICNVLCPTNFSLGKFLLFGISSKLLKLNTLSNQQLWR